MKHTLVIAFLLMITTTMYGQQKKICPAYWVVETNIHQKNFSIIRLYDSADNLVHEVRMDKVYFNVARPRHRKMLNQLLKGSYQRAEVTASKIKKESLTRF